MNTFVYWAMFGFILVNLVWYIMLVGKPMEPKLIRLWIWSVTASAIVQFLGVIYLYRS